MAHCGRAANSMAITQASRHPEQGPESQGTGSRRLWCTPRGLLENLSSSQTSPPPHLSRVTTQ